MRLVEIEWKDHNSLKGGWRSIDDIKSHAKPSIIQSVGAIVYEDDEIVSLIHTYSDESQALHGMNILKNCIVKRRYISFK